MRQKNWDRSLRRCVLDSPGQPRACDDCAGPSRMWAHCDQRLEGLETMDFTSKHTEKKQLKPWTAPEQQNYFDERTCLSCFHTVSPHVFCLCSFCEADLVPVFLSHACANLSLNVSTSLGFSFGSHLRPPDPHLGPHFLAVGLQVLPPTLTSLESIPLLLPSGCVPCRSPSSSFPFVSHLCASGLSSSVFREDRLTVSRVKPADLHRCADDIRPCSLRKRKNLTPPRHSTHFELVGWLKVNFTHSELRKFLSQNSPRRQGHQEMVSLCHPDLGRLMPQAAILWITSGTAW